MADENDSAAEEAPAVPTPEEVMPEGCNCNDKFILERCPVHNPLKEEGSKPPPAFGEEATLVTDADLHLEQPWGRYEGYIFDCPKCKFPAIMVNQNMGGFCVKCGAKVRVESKVVTDHIRSLE